ncbi:MAG TPA: carboxylating nicotinate-nucleotide diphosphorylase [bacterium]|nr:carboxylating nicotinate-nucleotide diphosphorylase [bacterium]
MNYSNRQRAVSAGKDLDFKKIRPLLKQALLEDAAWYDRTTYATVPPRFPTRGEVIAKGEGILAGLPVMAESFKLLDKRCRLKPLVREGARVRRGMKVAELKGFGRPLLSGERVALNLLSRISGIATLTRQFAGQIKGPRLYDTRKTTPLWRALERYAVRIGGGQNHRFNLAGHVLIKDNHLRLGGGVYACVKAARKLYGKGEFIEVEVETFDQASEALRAGADILLVDNASPKTFDKILKLLKGKAQVEVSGGLTLKNISQYSRLPVDRFSSGSLTHSAPSLDFSIELYPLK